jgi:hypothetical protein
MLVSERDARILKSHLFAYGLTDALGCVHVAKLLWHAKNGTVKKVNGTEQPLFQRWGYPSWDEFVEHGLKYHFGWANRRVVMYEKLVIQCGLILDAGLLKDVKITNLMEISTIITKTTVNAWLRDAEKLSCCELKAKVQRAKYRGERGESYLFTRRIPAKSIKKFKKTIRFAKKYFEVDNEGEALMKIVESFDKTYNRKVRRAA